MRREDAQLVVRYFHGLTPDDHARMGIDPAKVPDATEWISRLQEDLSRPLAERLGHVVLWEVDGAPVGHSSIGNLERPSHGHMHLHMWRSDLRARGHGRVLVLESVKRYLELFGLQVVYCQPNAFNVAP
jgi:RimJ/RimL family protein N-acetyltransferase